MENGLPDSIIKKTIRHLNHCGKNIQETWSKLGSSSKQFADFLKVRKLH